MWVPVAAMAGLPASCYTLHLPLPLPLVYTAVLQAEHGDKFFNYLWLFCECEQYTYLLHVYISPNHGSSVLQYWPVTHVTHSHLSTHLTHDPLTHCLLCRQVCTVDGGVVVIQRSTVWVHHLVRMAVRASRTLMRRHSSASVRPCTLGLHVRHLC